MCSLCFVAFVFATDLCILLFLFVCLFYFFAVFSCLLNRFAPIQRIASLESLMKEIQHAHVTPTLAYALAKVIIIVELRRFTYMLFLNRDDVLFFAH